jgi:hypothetical protein
MNNVQDANLELQSLDLDEAVDAILDRWSDGEIPSDEEDQEATPETVDETPDDDGDFEEDEDVSEDDDDTEADPDDEDEDTDEDDDDGDEDDADEEEAEEEAEAEGVTDETLIEIMVDGETKQASVKDLKRLYGQESALTRKSQDVATKRKEAEEALVNADHTYRTLTERAEARFKPYADLDMLVASRNLSNEDFTQLRQDAKAAEDDLKFLREEASSFYQTAQSNAQAQLQDQAKECSRVLETEIEGWGNDLYNDIRSYAVKQGLPQEQVDKYVDPGVIKILNKARMYDELKATAGTKKAKAVTSTGPKSKKKVLRSKKAPVTQDEGNRARIKKTQSKLISNGSRAGDLDDIADALLARWEQ